MVQFFAIFILSAILSFSAKADSWISLNAIRVVQSQKELAENIENSEPQNCFKVNDSKSELHLFNKACDDVRDGVTRSTQIFKISKAVPSALQEYIDKAKAEALREEKLKGHDADLLKIAQINEKYDALSKWVPDDTVGRLIYMDINSKPVLVGLLKSRIEKDETNIGFVANDEGESVQKPHIVELCSGPWRHLCVYKKSEKKFIWRFMHVPLSPEGYQDNEHPLTYKIKDIPYSILYSRGNDDFKALTYFWMKDKNPNSSAKYPLMDDWSNPLRAFDEQAKRISKERFRDTIPLREANYLTGLHPLNIVVVEVEENGVKKEKTFVHMGAEVYYARKIAEASCESETYNYSIFNLDEIPLQKPIHPNQLTHTNIGNLNPLAPLGYPTESFLPDEMAGMVEQYKSEVVVEAASGTFELPENATKRWSFVILAKAYNDLEYTTDYHNPVKEFLFLDQKEEGRWVTDLRAYNPNDPMPNNFLLKERGVVVSPGSIRFVWQNRTPDFMGKTHPVLRAPMSQYTLIPFTFSTKEDKDRNDLLRRQFRTNRFESSDMGTTHAVRGIKDNYFSLLSRINEEEKLSKLTPETIPSYVSHTQYINTNSGESTAVLVVDKTSDTLLQLLSDPAIRDLNKIINSVLERIYNAANPVDQIASEVAKQKVAEKQSLNIVEFYSHIGAESDGVTAYYEDQNMQIQSLREYRKQIKAQNPNLDIPDTYKFTTYETGPDGNTVEVIKTQKISEEIRNYVFAEKDVWVNGMPSYFTRENFLATVESDFLKMNDKTKSDEERKSSAKKMYEYIDTQGKYKRELDLYSESLGIPRG